MNWISRKIYTALNNELFLVLVGALAACMGGAIFGRSIVRPPTGSELVIFQGLLFFCGGISIPCLWLAFIFHESRVKSEKEAKQLLMKIYNWSNEQRFDASTKHKTVEGEPLNALNARNIPGSLAKVLQIMHENWSNVDPKRLPKQVNIAREIDEALGWGKRGDPLSEPSRDAKTIARLIKPDFINDTETGTN